MNGVWYLHAGWYLQACYSFSVYGFCGILYLFSLFYLFFCISLWTLTEFSNRSPIVCKCVTKYQLMCLQFYMYHTTLCVFISDDFMHEWRCERNDEGYAWPPIVAMHNTNESWTELWTFLFCSTDTREWNEQIHLVLLPFKIIAIYLISS